jgi:hypothetical protein
MGVSVGVGVGVRPLADCTDFRGREKNLRWSAGSARDNTPQSVIP